MPHLLTELEQRWMVFIDEQINMRSIAAYGGSDVYDIVCERSDEQGGHTEMLKMSGFVPETFAHHWIDAWNRSDAEAVLIHFADDAVFVSPLAATVTGNPELHGKDALRAYWTKALRSLSSPLHFALESFVWDGRKQALLIIYVSTEPGRDVRKCELMYFNRNALIDRGEAFVGAVLG